MLYRSLIALLLLIGLPGPAIAMQAPLGLQSQASQQKIETLAQVAKAMNKAFTELNEYIQKRNTEKTPKRTYDLGAYEDAPQLTALINQIPEENQNLRVTLRSLLDKVLKYDRATDDKLLPSLLTDFNQAIKLAISATEEAVKAASIQQNPSVPPLEQQLDQLILAKQAAKIINYNEFPLEARIALINYIWPILDPNNKQPTLNISSRLNIKPFYTWEYLQKIKTELIQAILEGQLDLLIQAKQKGTQINYAEQYKPQNLQDLKQKVETLLIQNDKRPIIDISRRLNIQDYATIDYLQTIRQDLGKALSRLELPTKIVPKISIQSVIEFGDQENYDRYISYIRGRLQGMNIKFEKITDQNGKEGLKVFIDPSDWALIQKVVDEALGLPRP